MLYSCSKEQDTSSLLTTTSESEVSFRAPNQGLFDGKENCIPNRIVNCIEIVIDGKPATAITEFQSIVSGNAEDVKNYFTGTSYSDLFSELSNTEQLSKLQSGNYDIVASVSKPNVYFVGVKDTNIANNYEFVLITK